MKKIEGVTLIALVITVIILLILAGVTIVALTGENGILGKSKKASEETNKQTATEIINLKITNAQMQIYTKEQRMPILKELAILLDPENDKEIQSVTKSSQRVSSLDWINDTDYTSIFTTLKDYPEYEFEINSDLKLDTINGVKVADNSTEELKKEMIELKQQNENLQRRIETLESQPKNIEKVDLMNQPLNILLTKEWTVRNLGEVTLSESIEKYKYLEIQVNIVDIDGNIFGESTILVAVDQIKYYNSDVLNWKNESLINLTIHMGSEAYAEVLGWFKDSKTLHFGGCKTGADWSYQIKKICGVK